MTPDLQAIVRSRIRTRHARRRKQLLPRMHEPSDLAYRAALLTVARDAQAQISAELDPWLRAHFDSPRDELAALFARLRVKTSERVQVKAPILARRFVRESAEVNRVAMNAQFRSVIKIDPFATNKGLESVMRTRVASNVDLITSIPEELLGEVEHVVRLRAVAGVRVEDIGKAVQERFSVSESRAQLIARDQVGKFNGQLARARQESLGVTNYTWSGSKDEKERADHLALEGQVFAYEDPPIVDSRTGERGNPGEPIQCRCQALPSVADVLDALGIDEGHDTFEEV